MTEPYITLREALETGRLADFVQQEECRGVGPASVKDLDQALRAASQPATPKQSAGRTSRSLSHDGSAGKRTR